MDPDETLRQIRELTALNAMGRLDDGQVERLCELVIVLDEWLMKGGFMPDVWREASGLL